MKFIDYFEKPSDAPGIYGILNIESGKVYVGSSVRMKNRWWSHQHLLRKGKHHNLHLQRSWDKHGENNFTFYVISRKVPVDQLHLLETKTIAAFRAGTGVYNTAPVGGTCLGLTFGPISETHREAIRQANRSRIYTEEMRQATRERFLGRPLSEEHKRNISLGGTGRKDSPETIHRRAISNTGKRRTPEAKEKMRLAALKRVPVSEETRAKMRAAHAGKPRAPHSEETKRKIGEKSRGRTPSLEARQKMSEAQKRRQERRRKAHPP